MWGLPVIKQAFWLINEQRSSQIANQIFCFRIKRAPFMARKLIGTLSTGQIYDADVTALPKNTGNENVVGHVTSKH